MNNKKYYIAIILALLIAVVYLWSRDKKEIVIPSQSNNFTSTNPMPVTVYDTITLEGKVEYVKVPNPVNEELLSKYNNSLDSIEKLNLFKEAITERKYLEVFSDSVQKITVESDVIGTLRSQRVSYITKPKTVVFKPNKNRLEVFTGLSVMLPIEANPLNTPDKLAVGANINIVTNKKIFTFAINSNKTILAGISFKL